MPPFSTIYKTPNKMSYNDLRDFQQDLLYQIVTSLFSNNIKIIDDDLINFELCS